MGERRTDLERAGKRRLKRMRKLKMIPGNAIDGDTYVSIYIKIRRIVVVSSTL